MRYGIFTKPIHVEKIVNFLNQHTNVDYIISTEKQEIDAYYYDVGISYCWPYKVKVGDKPWFNYHPAPLPEYPGLTNYAKPIADGVTSFGVTLHRMTDEIDKGPIIRRLDFPLLSPPTSTNELGTITHYYLYQLFKSTIRYLEAEVHNE